MTATVHRGPEFNPEMFKPMTALEVARYLKVSMRTLEEWRRSTKETGVLRGPPYSQSRDGGRTIYPYICVVRFGSGIAVGQEAAEASRFAVEPLLDLQKCNLLKLRLDYLLEPIG